MEVPISSKSTADGLAPDHQNPSPSLATTTPTDSPPTTPHFTPFHGNLSTPGHQYISVYHHKPTRRSCSMVPPMSTMPPTTSPRCFRAPRAENRRPTTIAHTCVQNAHASQKQLHRSNKQCLPQPTPFQKLGNSHKHKKQSPRATQSPYNRTKTGHTDPDTSSRHSPAVLCFIRIRWYPQPDSNTHTPTQSPGTCHFTTTAPCMLSRQNAHTAFNSYI